VAESLTSDAQEEGFAHPAVVIPFDRLFSSSIISSAAAENSAPPSYSLLLWALQFSSSAGSSFFCPGRTGPGFTSNASEGRRFAFKTSWFSSSPPVVHPHLPSCLFSARHLLSRNIDSGFKLD